MKWCDTCHQYREVGFVNGVCKTCISEKNLSTDEDKQKYVDQFIKTKGELWMITSISDIGIIGPMSASLLLRDYSKSTVEYERYYKRYIDQLYNGSRINMLFVAVQRFRRMEEDKPAYVKNATCRIQYELKKANGTKNLFWGCV